ETANRRSPSRSRTNDCKSSSVDTVIAPNLSPQAPQLRLHLFLGEPHRVMPVLPETKTLPASQPGQPFGRVLSARGTIAALRDKKREEAPAAASWSSSFRCH